MRRIRRSLRMPDGLSTIVAQATAQGKSALAVLRLSGPGVRGVLTGLGVTEAVCDDVGRVRLVRLRDPEDGSLIDQAMVVFHAAPRSYTGEDLAEITVHGGSLGPRLVLEACVRAGARLAEPGEFTRRRWAAGKMDGLQVEGLAALLEAESMGSRRAAIGRLEGGLSRRIRGLRDALVEVEALLAHHLDFPDEDEPPTPVRALVDRLASVGAALEVLRSTAPVARRMREGAVVALAGRPNAGKSSLFNAWLGEERVLVSSEPGTTRDAVEVGVLLGDMPVRLVDTAGLRESPEALESAGIEIAGRWLRAADAVLWMHRMEWGPPHPAEREAVLARVSGDKGRGMIVPVMSCADGVGFPVADAWGEVAGEAWVPLSVREGRGFVEVRTALARVLGAAALPQDALAEGSVLVRAEEVRSVSLAMDAVERAQRLLVEGGGAELAAVDVREARASLEALVGSIGTEEVLDHLFARFCIGK
jgi:tRNA modification GTPase